MTHPRPCPASPTQDVTDKAEQEALLTRWGRRHLVRTLLSCASFGVMVSLVVRRQQQR